MLRIRLRRVGKRKQPAYRVVVADSRAPRDGAFIESIGLYDPLTEPVTINIDEEKAKKWLQQGAQPSETVGKLLARQGVLPARTPAPKAPEKKKTETPETPETPAQPEETPPESE